MGWSGWLSDADLAEEVSLPEPDAEEEPRWWGTTWPDDDRAAWEREHGLRVCRRCHERDVLDPLGRCERCRTATGRCRWCGLDAVVYRRRAACRTCYRWLHRNAEGLSVDVVADRLLTAAVRRHARRGTQRKRSGDAH